jgi:hypothetical protein
LIPIYEIGDVLDWNETEDEYDIIMAIIVGGCQGYDSCSEKVLSAVQTW